MQWLKEYWQDRKKLQKVFPEAVFFLKKRPFAGRLKIWENGRLKALARAELEQLFEIEFVDGLYFESPRSLKKVVHSCFRARKFEEITREDEWFGLYYATEMQGACQPPVYLKWTGPYKGFGLFAEKDLEAGTFIGEYAGLVRRHFKPLDRANAYCFEYPMDLTGKSPFTIDAKTSGNAARFINHSPAPNLELLRAYGGGVMHILLRTLGPVVKDTELTYDYGPGYWRRRPRPL
ncbi:MAG: SET domain-containing protein-lysine N-methyltransferase [Parachlamydiales bacterium]|jgi:hypothetical protein